jgi:hypothetical protein
MTKPKSKPKAATRSTARKPASRKRSAPASSRSIAGPDTKHARTKTGMGRPPTAPMRSSWYESTSALNAYGASMNVA